MFTLLFFYHLLGNAVNVGLQRRKIIDTPQHSSHCQEKKNIGEYLSVWHKSVTFAQDKLHSNIQE